MLTERRRKRLKGLAEPIRRQAEATRHQADVERQLEAEWWEIFHAQGTVDRIGEAVDEDDARAGYCPVCRTYIDPIDGCDCAGRSSQDI